MEKEIVFNLIEHNSGTSEHIRRFYHHLYNIPNHEHAVRDLEKKPSRRDRYSPYLWTST